MASLQKRGNVYYARYWLGKKQRKVCLHTKSYPMAKEKLRQIESSLAQGAELPLVVPENSSVQTHSGIGHHFLRRRSRLRSLGGRICPSIR